MEQAPYWMWTKQNNNQDHQLIQSSSKNISSCYDSWEEQAFAEDAAGSLGGGGCIWPPRSYSCSFCGREFRSAQALGGHMNVHRRDRARLKVQSPTPPTPNENLLDQEHQQTHINQIRDPFLSLRYQYSSHVFPVGSPNPDCSPAFLHQSSYLPSFHVPENQNRSPFRSKLVSDDRSQFITDLTSEEDIIRSEPAGHRAKEGCTKTDLSSLSLNLVPSKNSTRLSAMPDTMEIRAASGCKRRREDESSQVSLVKLRSTLVGRNNHVQSGILKLCPSSSEDLDLELRLGDRPKVN